MKKKIRVRKKSFGQGTIEYLIILAIIIVIALLLTGIIQTFVQQGNITKSTNQIEGLIGSGGISIADIITNSDGDGIIQLKNTGVENLTIKKILINDTNKDYSNSNQLILGQDKIFRIITDECTDETMTITITIIYETQYGLEKRVVFQDIQIECGEYTLPEEEEEPETVLFSGGSGTLTAPYQITTWTDLNQIRDYLDANFILINNLSDSTTDYSGIGDDWEPIGNNLTNFNGSFNGNDKNIYDLIIDKGEYSAVGLFEYLGSGSEIKDLGLLNSIVKGFTAGTIVGVNDGEVTNVYVQNGEVEDGDWYAGATIGGLVGSNTTNGIISNTYFSGDVNSIEWDSGGLVGSNTGIINNSYSIANITTYGICDAMGPTCTTGGLVGINDGNINNSYFAGTIDSTHETKGGLIGWNGTQGNGIITNGAWLILDGFNAIRYDQYYGDGAINRLSDEEIGTDETLDSNFYSNTHPVYALGQEGGWESPWIWNSNTYPTLE